MARKFFVESTNIKGDYLSLSGDEHNHLSKVLRAKPDEEMIACTKDYEYLCKIEKIEKTQTLCKIISKTKIENDSLNITLFQASLKGEHMDYAIQKATELNVKTFVPFLSSFVVAKIDNKKVERFKKISQEACKQSGRKALMEIGDVLTFEQMLEELKSFDKVIFAYENSNVSAKEVISSLKETDEIALIVGSEGGFSEMEAQKLVANGAKEISLGKNILRGETAGLVLASAVMFELNQFKKI